MASLRTYGVKPFCVAVIHGGPGAPGEMAPVARELSSIGGVLEPLQTAGTVDGQVRELRDVLRTDADPPVTLIGWSWGAWLSFILAARHPSLVGKLILIGSAAFEEEYAENIMADRLGRLSEAERIEVIDLIDAVNAPAVADKNTPMARFGALMARADAYDPMPYESELLEYQYDINHSVWREAAALRKTGELLRLGEKISCPVVAIHGDYDPHLPGGVRGPLSRVLKDFRFILLEKCGHQPWIERHARERFYEVLKGEVAGR